MELLVNIDVDDLEQAIRFDCAAFDLRVGRRFGAAGVEMLGGSSAIYLLAKRAGTPASPVAPVLRDYARHWTPVHLDVVVDDIDEAVHKAVQAGARLEQSVSTNRWGRLALLSDPFGHGFCFVQFLGKGYDEITS